MPGKSNCCWFKSLYVIQMIMQSCYIFDDHVILSNQMGGRILIWTPQQLEIWYANGR